MKFFFAWLTLKNLKIGHKLLIVGAPFLLPIGVLFWIVFQRGSADAAAAKKERDGVEYARPLRALLRDVAGHEVRAARTLHGAGSARGDLEAAAAQVDADAAGVDAVDQKYGAELRTTAKWQAVRTRWTTLKAGVLALKPAASREAHAGLLADIASLMTDIQESSGLLLDSDAGPHFLQEALLVSLPRGSAEMETLRDLADDTMSEEVMGVGSAPRTLAPEERSRIAVSIAGASAAKDALAQALAGAFRTAPALQERLRGLNQQQSAARQALLDFVETRILKDTNIDAKPGEFSEVATRSTAADFALADAMDSELIGLLTARIDILYRNLAVVLTAIAVVLALAVAGAYRATRTITRQAADIRDLFARISVGELQARARILTDDELGRTAASLNAMLDNTVALFQSREERDAIEEAIRKLLREIGGVAEGDLTKDAEVTKDLIGPIADSFNIMIGQLRRIIGHVKETTSAVGAASDDIRASAGRLARGTEIQTRRIGETFHSVEEMARSAQDVARASDQGAQVAAQALAGATRGAAAVGDTIHVMNGIRNRAQETARRILRLSESSQEIGEIVGLIDDIADRTSILALNASIQAASAGEAGRGFAVVAEEVERLAERSAVATRKIAGLVRAIQAETGAATTAMEVSTREVAEGSRVADQAGQALAQIGAVSQTQATLIRSISEEARRQAAASRGVAQAMGEISEITQQTAAGAGEGAAAVGRLARLADELRESVSAFRLPAADEAAAPVAPSRIEAEADSVSIPEPFDAVGGPVPIPTDFALPDRV
jgi:methyl-accepting chemotaxis protein